MDPYARPEFPSSVALVGRTIVAWASLERCSRASVDRREEKYTARNYNEHQCCCEWLVQVDRDSETRVWKSLSGVSIPITDLNAKFPNFSLYSIVAMEDENEVLDWGNEDDEQQHQELQRKASLADLTPKRNTGDTDDVEDSVSLGEDEDEQDRYGFDEEPAHSTGYDDSKPASTPKSMSQDRDQQRPHSSTDLRREDSSTTQLNSSTGSPHRNQGSANQKSPQRSQSFTSATRITHALPPKPVVTNVPFLHPSHPSIVEATAMSTRATGRSGGKSTSTGPADLDLIPLPPGWEVRHPRGGSGREVYYYNIQTQESTWSRPVSSSTSTSRSGNTRRHRDSSLSAGDRSLSPPISDVSHPQELRSNRALPQGQPDISDIQKMSSGPNSGLSYKDRHYRPAGADDDPALVEKNRRGDRNDVDPRFNPQPERSFTPPSPHRPRERERSQSPPLIIPSNPLRGRDSRPSRGTRSGRGGRPNTDADLATLRGRDPQADFGPPRGARGSAPSEAPNDFNGYQQPSRRPPRQQHQNADLPFEAPLFEERPAMRRNGSTRSRNRDHEHSQMVEMHENRTQNMTASRTRSPPPHLSDREQAFQAQREAEQPPTTQSASAPISTQGVQSSRKRERPSRFDRPPVATSPVLSSLIASFSTPEAAAAAAAAAAATSRVRPEDDIYVPDDILAPQDELRSHEAPRAELTRPSNSQQVVSADDFGPSRYPKKHSRADDREYDKDRALPSSELGRSSPSSEARPKRVPLPPQSDKFREVASQPPQRAFHGDKGPASHNQHRPQSQLSPLLSSNVLPLGPREQRATNTNSIPINGPPSGPRYPPQNQGRGELEASRSLNPSHASSSSKDRDRRGERRLSETAFSHSFAPSENIMDVDIDDHPSTSRIPPSPLSRKPNDEAGLRVGSGMYADREIESAGDAPPRGPRAMAKPSVSTSGSGYASHSTSPTTPFIYGHNAGNRPRDRSPPPHVQSRANDGNARREYEFDQYPPHSMDRGQNRRDLRPRPNEYPRPPPSGYPKLSGTNSVPIGTSRKPPVVLGAPPPGKTYITHAGPPPGISTANMEPVRNMRARGGPPPHKESYERPGYKEMPSMDYRPGRSENGASRQHEISSVLMEPRQSPVNPTNPHDTNRGRRDGGYVDRGNQSRYNQAPPSDVGRGPPRTWTPRSPTRDLPRPHYDQHRSTTPPIPNIPLQTSPTWTPRDMARQYEDLSIHQRDHGPPPKPEDRPIQHQDEGPAPGRERYGEQAVHRSGSLEKRLSEPYIEHFPEPVRQPHALPPNPALHRGHNPMHSETRWQADRHEPGPIRPGWGEPRDVPSYRPNEAPHSRSFNDQSRGDVDMRGGRPPRIRRPQPPPQPPGESTLGMDIDDPASRPLSQEYEAPQRPEIPRRGGSLLDRLSLDQNGDSSTDGPPQSLRDRVQVPSKRDREEIEGDRHGHMMDTSFEDDVYDPNKKARRRSGKVRKVRRGGPP